MDSDDDSEWEYEYHESETETFYVTLDLSSYSVPVRNPSKGDKAPPATEPPPIQPAQNADPLTANLDPRLAPPPDRQTSSAQIPVRTEDNGEPDTMASGGQPLPAQLSSADHIQILELHSRNPLMSYKSQLYSCEWTSTLGTDVLLAANRAEGSDTEGQSAGGAPLRSFPGFDLVATSRIKLSARPVQATPHVRGPTAITSTAPQTAPLSMIALPTAANSSSASPYNSGPASPNPTPVNATMGGATPLIQIPVEESATPQRQNQAAFLSRLMNIKRAKGEADEVTVTISSHHEIRRRGLAASHQRGRGRSRGRSRRAGRARGLGRGATGTNNGGVEHYVVQQSEYWPHGRQEHNQDQGYEERLLADPGSVDAPMTDPDGNNERAGYTDMQTQIDDREM